MNTETENKYMPNIVGEMMFALPRVAFQGTIVVVTNIAETNHAVEYLSKFDIVGFDTETKQVFQKGVSHLPALLQLATDSRAYLFRLNSTGIPTSLMKFLENANISKVGAAVHDDIKALKKLRRMKPAGFVDIQTVVGEYGIMDKSVQKIAAIVLGVRISKSQRLTNWANPMLTDSQQTYAATDAWVCREVYVKLTRE